MIRAKKSLGQNFLHSSSALKAIVGAGSLSANDTVLEIGPGEGALTKLLLATGAKVIAVEKDDRLIPILEETFAEEIKTKKFILVHADVLDFDGKKYGIKPSAYTLIANIPYYLTGLIFRQFIGGALPPIRAVLLVQHEVAKRVVARDGKESILSLSIKAFGTPRIVTKVPRTAFRPAPNVDSAVLAIDVIHDGGFSKKEKDVFFDVLHAGFAHKRKKALSNLKEVFPKNTIEGAFATLTLPENTRAEDISLADWKAIARSVQ